MPEGGGYARSLGKESHFAVMVMESQYAEGKKVR
jgi:hypothetical protein